MDPQPLRRRFATTRWSLVVAIGNAGSPEARAALATLCETYWQPVHHFVRHTGRSTEEARDLTQAFFTRVIEKGDFKNACPERGRFRTFVLTAVRHFLANQADHDGALKRGGGQVVVRIGVAPHEAGAGFHEPASEETPETIFEERWAVAVLAAAMARLESDCDRSGRRPQFEALRPFLTGDGVPSYSAAAEALTMAEGSVRVAVHRLRQQYGQCLRETLADTVENPADVDQELEYLLAVISRRHLSTSLEHS